MTATIFINTQIPAMTTGTTDFMISSGLRTSEQIPTPALALPYAAPRLAKIKSWCITDVAKEVVVWIFCHFVSFLNEISDWLLIINLYFIWLSKFPVCQISLLLVFRINKLIHKIMENERNSWAKLILTKLKSLKPNCFRRSNVQLARRNRCKIIFSQLIYHLETFMNNFFLLDF